VDKERWLSALIKRANRWQAFLQAISTLSEFRNCGNEWRLAPSVGGRLFFHQTPDLSLLGLRRCHQLRDRVDYCLESSYESRARTQDSALIKAHLRKTAIKWRLYAFEIVNRVGGIGEGLSGIVQLFFHLCFRSREEPLVLPDWVGTALTLPTTADAFLMLSPFKSRRERAPESDAL
jgi:hypothetical protein